MIAYRELTRQELTVLRRSFDRWGIFDFVLEKKILLREDKSLGTSRKEIYLTTKDVAQVLVEWGPLSHFGIMIGHLTRRTFTPSMAGADLISRVSDKFPFVVVNRSAEALVLYGRDIMSGSILNSRGATKNNKLVIILNESRFAIGLGITMRSLENTIDLKGDRIIVKTMIDAGHYLRDETPGLKRKYIPREPPEEKMNSSYRSP
jgi:ribosome biogenesis protein Nip4